MKTSETGLAQREGYHHGDLRAALIRAADEILAEKGVEGFTLRAAARRAGVSPAAPAYHFASVKGLLTEIAILGYEDLKRFMDIEGLKGSRASLLRAQAAGYVRFALTYPGRFRVMFRPDLHVVEDERLHDAAVAALSRMAGTACPGVAVSPGTMPDPCDLSAMLAAWSQAHGIAQLFLDGKFGAFSKAPTPAGAADELLDGILRAAWPDEGDK